MNFEKMKELLDDSPIIYGKTTEKNLILTTGTVFFWLPVECKKELLSVFETEHEKIDYNVEAFLIMKYDDDIFLSELEETDEDYQRMGYALKAITEYREFVSAKFVPILGLNSIPMSDLPAFLKIVNTAIFETEYGLLQVSDDYAELVFQILTEFSTKKIKYSVDKMNNILYAKNDVAEAAICSITTPEEIKRLFTKKFLI